MVVIVGQQCSGMKIIQGYAVEIFADTFSHHGEGLRHGEEVDSVAYWSAVIMAVVRLGRKSNSKCKCLQSEKRFINRLREG